jgi:drug/metabolite transporter (DMT)-like permease
VCQTRHTAGVNANPARAVPALELVPERVPGPVPDHATGDTEEIHAEPGADTVLPVAILLALLSSLLWGSGDFCGGTASRRLPSQVVVLGSQAVGLVLAIVAALVTGAFHDPTGYLPWAIGAGLTGVTGLLFFYRALAIGTMGVVSPIAALSVLVPVVIALATGNVPSAVVGIGIVIAIVGVVALSGPERGAGAGLRPAVLAAMSAVCFGFALYFIARASAYSPLMTMVAMRVSSVLPLGIAIGIAGARGSLGSLRVPGRVRLLVVVAGTLDVTANVMFGVASTLGALAVVAVLGSLYPAGTVLLARIVHGERLARIQQLGVLTALVGIALIAGGSGN